MIPFLAGEPITTDRVLAPVMYQEILSGGPTVDDDETSIGGINVITTPGSTLVPGCWFNAVGTGDGVTTGDRYRLRIRIGSVTGPIHGSDTQEIGEGENRLSFCIPMGMVLTATAPLDTFIVTLQRIVGSGAMDNLGGNPSYVSVLSLPAST